MATLVVLAGRMIPTEEILKVSSRYLDWFRFYEFFFVKNPTNCPIIGLVPYMRFDLLLINRFFCWQNRETSGGVNRLAIEFVAPSLGNRKS